MIQMADEDNLEVSDTYCRRENLEFLMGEMGIDCK